VGHAAFFDLAFTAPRTVTLDTPATLGSLTVNSAEAPVIAGSAALTFDNGPAALAAVVAVAQGHPVVQAPLTLSRRTAVSVSAAASLTLAGPVSGPDALDIAGPGALILSGTNTAAQTLVHSGATLALTADGAQQAPLTVDGATLSAAVSSAVSSPVLAGPFGAALSADGGQTLTLAGTVSGDGSVTKAGPGAAALTGTLAYRGATAVTGGTLALATPPPAALTLGAGTLAYTGAAAAALPGYTLNTASNRLAAVLASAADLAVTGRVNAVAGGFVKAGPGTLAFTYPGAQTLGVGVSAAQDTRLDIGPDGDAPTQGFTSFSIAEGTVALGAENQINTLAGNLRIGTYSTGAAGAETAAHLVIDGGATTVSGSIAVGRGNGNAATAPTPLQSSLTINGGAVTSGDFTLGNNGGNTAGYNARPAVTVNGGTVAATQLNIGEHFGSAATFTLHDGAVTFSGAVQVGHQTAGGGTATLDIRGGSLSVTNDINLGVTASATGTLHLAGGRVSVRNVTVGSGYGRILFDGGTLSLRTGPMDKPQELLVQEGGARLDVPSDRFTLALPLLSGAAGDGGLTKTGAGMLALDASANHTYTGPTRVQEGTLAFRSVTASPLPSATALTVAPGASFHASSESGAAARIVAVAGLTLGEPAPAAAAGLALWCSAGGSCDQFAVNGSPALGQVAVSLYQLGSLDPALYAGVYTVIVYTGADPDIAGLSVANPVASRSYAFSVDSTNKRVLLTVTSVGSQGDAVWTADSDGLWSQGANWQNGAPPTAIAQPALFANVLSQNRTVTVDAAAALGGLTFDATNRYTVAGGETLTLSGDAAALTLLRGNHTVAAPLAVGGTANVSLAPSGNTLTLAGPVTGGASAALTLATAGTVIVSNSAVGTAFTVNTGTLQLTGAALNGTLRYTGGSVLATGNAAVNGAVELPPGDRSLRANNGMTLTVNGPILGAGNLVKENEGTVELAAPNRYSGSTRVTVGTLALRGSGTPGKGAIILSGGVLASAGETPIAFGNAIGLTNNATVRTDAPLTTGGPLTMPAPRTLTKEGANIWNFAGSLDVSGSYNNRFVLRDGTLRFAPGAFFRMTGAESIADPINARQQFLAGDVNDRDLRITIESNATVIAGSFGVHWNNGTGFGSTFTLTQNGGSFTLLALQSLAFGDGSNMVIRVTSNGGELRQIPDDAWADIGTRSKVDWRVNGGTVSLGRAAFGRQNGSGGGRLGGGTTLTINDGIWEARDFFSWKSTDDNAATNTVTLGCGIPRQGRFGIPATRRYHNGGRVILNLNGGVLETLGLSEFAAAQSASLSDYLYGVNELNVLAGGAVIDVPGTNSAAITHTFTPGAGGDGGVTKLGGGALTLTADVTLTGRVSVVAGRLDAAFTAAPDLTVNADGALDLTQSAGNARFTNVEGAGLATNGTLAVKGALSPGDTAGEPGTFRAQNLAFEEGATLRYDWSEAHHDLFAVSGLLTGASGGFIDFGRESGDEIPIPLTAVLGTCGTFSGNFGGWKMRNTGYPANRAMSARITVEDGVVILNVTNSGFLLILK
jgi:autotransporter-associated beta strand protein